MATFEESTLNMIEKLIARIGEIEAKVSKTEEPTKPTEEDKKQSEDLTSDQITNIVDNYNL